MVPMTISCITLPLFLTTNFTVSPCLIERLAGVKRILSLMSTRTVREAFFGSPSRPNGCSSVEMARAVLGPCDLSLCANTGAAKASEASEASRTRFLVMSPFS